MLYFQNFLRTWALLMLNAARMLHSSSVVLGQYVSKSKVLKRTAILILYLP